LHPEWGVARALFHDEVTSLDGAVLRQLEAALSPGEGEGGHAGHATRAPAMVPLMAACIPALSELKPVLRAMLHYHLGSHTLRTRQLMMELQQA
jgi:DNA repair protein RecO (recombination protein O)